MKQINAVILVGGLLLERAPRAVLIPEHELETYYEPALQEFQDYLRCEWKTTFEPPVNFKQLVMDHVRRYLDQRRKRFGL